MESGGGRAQCGEMYRHLLVVLNRCRNWRGREDCIITCLVGLSKFELGSP